MTEKREKKPLHKRVWFIILMVFFGFCLLVAIFGNDNESSKKSKDLPSYNFEDTKQSETETKVKEEPATETKAEETSAEPEVSKEFKNALKNAKNYAETMHMSKKAIYKQLTSEYGENFPAEAAQYAVDNLEWNYKENAYKTAKIYQDKMSMSISKIKEQLISEYGEQFTEEEAQYAIDKLSSEQ